MRIIYEIFVLMSRTNPGTDYHCANSPQNASRAGYKSLNEGNGAEFNVTTGPKGLQATNVS
jgi:hypothetical protein